MIQNTKAFLIFFVLLETDVITDPDHHIYIKGLLVEISVTSSHILTMSSKVRAHKAKCAVHQLETDGSTTLVTHHTEKTRSSRCR